MNLIVPPYLKTGDTIGIAASARKVNKIDIECAQSYLISQGFKVKLASNIYAQYFQFAGTDEQRVAGIQELIDDNEVKAIIFARGGYGSVRVVDYINFNSLIGQPKWLIGFSDITVFHSRLQSLNMASIHGAMASNLGVTDLSSGFFVTDDSKSNLINVLKGESTEYIIANHELNSLQSSISGKIIGGNLSVLYSLSGSKDDIITDDCILLLEDIDEYIYHFDRMIQWLKRSNKLKKCKAIVVGHLTSMKNLDESNPFGMSAFEILRNASDQFNIPIVFNLPFGHEPNNLPFVMGGLYTFEPTESGVKISRNQV